MEEKYELVNGEEITLSAASIPHLRIQRKLSRIIDNYLKGKRCELFCEAKVVFDDKNWLQPNLLVVCDKDKIKLTQIEGAPDFVAEVTSPSTHGRDCKEKMHAYLRYGVREYWIIDLQKKRVVTYVNGDPLMTAIYSFDDEIPVSIYDGALTIRIEDCLQ